jgi:hypothetical protein
MSRHVQLNNIEHRSLRVCNARGARWGDATMHAPVVPGEFRSVQGQYPIVFARAAEGVRPLALFGLRQGQNLFLQGEGWDAHYLPLAVERQPFLIGPGSDGEPSIHVDLDHPRVGTEEGEMLFLQHGGTTPFLDRMASVLRALHEGLEAIPAFVAALEAHRLLESFVLDVEFVDGSQHRLAGFHVIDEDRLRGLDDATVVELHRAGHLEAIHMAMASMAQFRGLIERSNRAIAAGR